MSAPGANIFSWAAAVFLWIALDASAICKAAQPADPIRRTPGLSFIDTGFENASPLWYQIAADGSVELHLLYDHERDTPNRAAGHIHFLIHGQPGSSLTFEFKNLDNIYNGRPGSVAKELKAVVVSSDGHSWTPMPLEAIPTNRVRITLQMPGPKLFVARVEPYVLSDLDHFLSSIRTNPQIQIDVIGKTVQGRDLEIVRIGNEAAPKRVFMRARAHPWEPGGNWVIEGLTHRLLAGDARAKQLLDHYCVYLLPMANKDGVAHGRTRFNLNGKDLNRDWAEPANGQLAPENHALEQWLLGMIGKGLKPHLAIEWHNDGYGNLHVGKPPVPGLEGYLSRMRRLEKLLREHTWFREGVEFGSSQNSGTLGDGWLARFQIDAVVHELNCNWIAGLQDYPTARHWREYGASLCEVLDAYFAEQK